MTHDPPFDDEDTSDSEEFAPSSLQWHKDGHTRLIQLLGFTHHHHFALRTLLCLCDVKTQPPDTDTVYMSVERITDTYIGILYSDIVENQRMDPKVSGLNAIKFRISSQLSQYLIELIQVLGPEDIAVLETPEDWSFVDWEDHQNKWAPKYNLMSDYKLLKVIFMSACILVNCLLVLHLDENGIANIIKNPYLNMIQDIWQIHTAVVTTCIYIDRRLENENEDTPEDILEILKGSSMLRYISAYFLNSPNLESEQDHNCDRYIDDLRRDHFFSIYEPFNRSKANGGALLKDIRLFRLAQYLVEPTGDVRRIDIVPLEMHDKYDEDIKYIFEYLDEQEFQNFQEEQEKKQKQVDPMCYWREGEGPRVQVYKKDGELDYTNYNNYYNTIEHPNRINIFDGNDGTGGSGGKEHTVTIVNGEIIADSNNETNNTNNGIEHSDRQKALNISYHPSQATIESSSHVPGTRLEHLRSYGKQVIIDTPSTAQTLLIQMFNDDYEDLQILFWSLASTVVYDGDHASMVSGVLFADDPPADIVTRFSAENLLTPVLSVKYFELLLLKEPQYARFLFLLILKSEADPNSLVWELCHETNLSNTFIDFMYQIIADVPVITGYNLPGEELDLFIDDTLRNFVIQEFLQGAGEFLLAADGINIGEGIEIRLSQTVTVKFVSYICLLIGTLVTNHFLGPHTPDALMVVSSFLVDFMARSSGARKLYFEIKQLIIEAEEAREIPIKEMISLELEKNTFKNGPKTYDELLEGVLKTVVNLHTLSSEGKADPDFDIQSHIKLFMDQYPYISEDQGFIDTLIDEIPFFEQTMQEKLAIAMITGSLKFGESMRLNDSVTADSTGLERRKGKKH